jgi:hypothetical protein
MVKFDKDEAIKRINANLKELSKLAPDDEKRKALIDEIEKLREVTKSDKSKYIEIGLKVAGALVVMGAAIVLEDHGKFVGKTASKFMITHF